MRRKQQLTKWIGYGLILLLWHLPTRASAEHDPVLVGAGDITECGSPGAAATADLLDGNDGTVFTVGDHAYQAGTPAEFRDCYEPTWGRHKTRTRPVPGNHDYRTTEGLPYYTYFGDRAGEAGKGYYSYDLGAWHIVALNSNIAVEAGSAQEQWLRADLAAHKTTCSLAYWHVPLFSSGHNGNEPKLLALWRVLFEFGVEVVVNGHDHDYERFTPQNPDGQAETTRGIREFVVGTGGARLRKIHGQHINSEIWDDATWGILTLTLHPMSYEWEFIPVAGGTFRDAGSAVCVPPREDPT